MKFKATTFYRYILSAIIHPKNFLFCHKYPFYKVKDALGKFIGYDFTEYDLIPAGWQKAFGKELTEDLVNAFKEDGIKKRDWESVLYFTDIKEKWGTLCLYAVTNDKIQNILDKYEAKSLSFCIYCGKPVKYCTSGYVLYLCEDCYKDIKANGKGLK